MKVTRCKQSTVRYCFCFVSFCMFAVFFYLVGEGAYKLEVQNEINLWMKKKSSL